MGYDGGVSLSSQPAALALGAALALTWGCEFKGAASGGSPAADAAPDSRTTSPALSDDGLLARYYLDDPGVLANQVEPLPLTVALDGGEPKQCEPRAGTAGLCWTRVGRDSMAVAEIAGSSLENELSNSTQLTIELVFTLNAGQEDGSRVLQLGAKDGSQDALTIVADSDDGGLLGFTFGTARLSTSFVTPRERAVVHATASTTRVVQQNRIKLYIDGVEAVLGIAPCGGDPCNFPAQDAALAVNAWFFTVGNSPSGQRSISGVVHYVAIYDRPFTKERIDWHHKILAMSDDTPE